MTKKSVDIDEPLYKPGDPRPFGYLAFFEWADVQEAAGLEQTRCPMCSLWNYPQEFSTKTIDVKADGSGTAIVCRSCAEKLE